MKYPCEEKFHAQLLHACKFSVDCKMFGAYCYLSEIGGTIPLLHGPLGCAFFPKLAPPDAIRRQLLGIDEVPPLPCTAMEQRDIVYGGAEKLARAIVDADRYYRPDLIGIIVSCPAAIIGDDIREIVASVKKQINADVIYTPSSAGFGDDERTDSADHHSDDIVRLWKNPECKPKWGIEKCGRLDTLYSLVEQLVEEPKKKADRSINIDTYGRFHFFEDLAKETMEIRKILGETGIGVNTIFPGCSVADIKRMAEASLNVMRRSERSAILLKERFGIDYLFDPLASRYLGVEGIRRFYRDVAGKFGLQNRMNRVLEDVEADVESKLTRIRGEIRGKRISYTVTPSTVTPEFMRILEDLGLVIKCICVNTDWWKRWGLSEDAARQVIEAFQIEIGKLRSSPHVYIDLDINEETERIKESGTDLAVIDVLISDPSRVMYYEDRGIKALSPYMMRYSAFRISYLQIIHLGEIIEAKLKSPLPVRDLLYLRYNYHGHRFPTMLSDLGEEILWEEIMQNVWRDNNGIC
jgi:nitrogenase molybdenum-iron protein alpha/beta subunit